MRRCLQVGMCGPYSTVELMHTVPVEGQQTVGWSDVDAISSKYMMTQPQHTLVHENMCKLVSEHYVLHA